MLLATVALAVGTGGGALGPLLLVLAAAVVGHAVVAGSARICRACNELDRASG